MLKSLSIISLKSSSNAKKYFHLDFPHKLLFKDINQVRTFLMLNLGPLDLRCTTLLLYLPYSYCAVLKHPKIRLLAASVICVINIAFSAHTAHILCLNIFLNF